ncbi:MAG: MaoC family dehydratase N-terminal domain-containing protein [Deltaproteobacteria bacterium]|nr:MaoC family dehydratase N-terminal domain-containing protein [Deltaproteobacteria bacterium]
MEDSIEDKERASFLESLRSGVGRESGAPVPARDRVNQPMIRHWSDAMADFNPVYIDPDFAANSVHGEIVAPPAMLNAWGMPGLVPPESRRQGGIETYALLDAAGYTSVVATNSEHDYVRYLKLDERIHGSISLVDVSSEKKTGLGTGHFVTTVTEYTTDSGESVGSMTFRILKFKPGTGRIPAGSGATTPSGERPTRPEPGVSRDTQFFWDGIEQGELRIQKCECGALHHPPMVRCPRCGAYDLGYIVASGRGKVYSHVEPVHPRVPSFDYPLVVGLIELEEGTRLLSNVIDLDPDQVEIGMDVELVIQECNGVTLPVFRPLRPARRETTLRFDEVQLGDKLAPCPIPITPTLIVATAIASRDYQDVHHDRDLAIKRGSPDIFMNILTSSGLSSRYVTDWAGPEAILKNLRIRLGAPNYPYDTMTMSGEVTDKSAERGSGTISVSIRGYNRLGDHLTGTIDLELPQPASA